MRGWWMLTKGSVRAATMAVEAIALAVNSQGSVRTATTTDWKVQGAMVQTKMTVAVARARSWCTQLRQWQGRRWKRLALLALMMALITAAAEVGSSGLR